MTITTTLNAIRQHSPCEEGWEKLLKSLGKSRADDEPLMFSTILSSNGLDDALWCLRSICPQHDREVRLFAADCAERVLHLFESKHPDDDRPRKAIEAARAFANGEIDDAARDAARAAAGDAAGDAAWAAARDAAWAAARDAARAAARAAAGAAARDAAGDAAWAAARDAAWAAAWAAARDAAWAAAWDAAWAAEKLIQSDLLIKHFG